MPRVIMEEQPSPPRLLVSRAEAEGKLREQIDKGRELEHKLFLAPEPLRAAQAEKLKWSDYNLELLQRLFDNQSVAEEYKGRTIFYESGLAFQSFEVEAQDFRTTMNKYIACLESIMQRLELFPEHVAGMASMSAVESPTTLGTDIFVVHGRDGEAKESVARFIGKLDLKPVILHEQPNKGRTIIEKFEDYSNVGFAVVLLTPDDICAAQDKPGECKLRARQNVVFELGYFIGKLGRSRVCALYKEGVEIPTDYHGVLYIPMDPGGGWQLSLAKEI